MYLQNVKLFLIIFSDSFYKFITNIHKNIYTSRIISTKTWLNIDILSKKNKIKDPSLKL